MLKGLEGYVWLWGLSVHFLPQPTKSGSEGNVKEWFCPTTRGAAGGSLSRPSLRLFTYCSHTFSLFTISLRQLGLWQHVVSSLNSLANELMPQWAQVHFWRDPTGLSEQVNAGGRGGPVGCDICCRETRPRWGSYSKVVHLEKCNYEDQILLASNRWKFRIAPPTNYSLFFHIMH